MIGKTRQNAAAEMVEIFDPQAGKARGLLRHPPAAGKFRHLRRRPAPDLVHWIAHYWIVSWDLRGREPHLQETVPHPNFHLVWENETATVSGVYTDKFTRRLEGQSRVFGVKFTPGGFHPFLNASASTLANRTIPAERIFGADAGVLQAALAGSGNEARQVQAANAFFRARVPAPDQTIGLAGQLVGRILSEPDIKTVEDLAIRTGIGKRSMQRIFSEYVGVSPKWVIRRYRLHELIERFNSGDPLDWPQLALELGYFDQAHLINDFRSIVGCSPTRFRKRTPGSS
jgi:AraC-like DNA-binding protein